MWTWWLPSLYFRMHEDFLKATALVAQLLVTSQGQGFRERRLDAIKWFQVLGFLAVWHRRKSGRKTSKVEASSSTSPTTSTTG